MNTGAIQNAMIEISELNKKVAYIKGSPIVTPRQKIQDKVIKCTPMSNSWKASLTSKFWYTGYKGTMNEQQQSMLRVREFLLKFYGEQVCLPYSDVDTLKILSRGQLWYGDKVDFKRGEPSQCHRNSCRLWEVNKYISVICTGYALSNDGLWREHSWLVHIKPRVNRIIETTEPRLAYFGYAMTTIECMQFVNDCLY